MFKGSNPQAREDAEILNGLLRVRRTTERSEGLMWLLGRREYYAAVSVAPGSAGVRYDAETETLYLFEVPVVRVDKGSYAMLVKPANRRDDGKGEKYELTISGRSSRGAWTTLQVSAQLAADQGHTVTLRRVIFGSAASGIEAASVAWGTLGWRAAWLSEIDPFASGVLAYRHPDVPNLGDMTRLPEWILSGVITAPDVFVAGTPCQAFSIAGLRKSLEDARGNLSLTYCEIVNAIDTARAERNEEPCIAVWENVPGVLSTKDNAFGCFLAGLAGEDVPLVAAGGRWPDAGLVVGPARAVAWRVLDAQFFGLAQRRRRVFVVASARDGFDPGAVLFEFDGVRRNTPPVREAREGAAGSVDGGIDERGLQHTVGTLCAEGFDASEDGTGRGTGRGTPLVPVSVALRGRDGGAACEIGDDVAFTLRASSGGGDKPHAMVPVAGTRMGNRAPQVQQSMQVRRLTPRECERLQGFPDDYTRIPWRRKPAEDCPDGPRYKALGNSMAVPVMEWIGARIVMHLEGVI